MAHDLFIHLRTRSAYSLSEGAITPGEIVELCKKHHMPAVGITDRNNLFGSLEISNACAKNGIQPIIGALMHLERRHQSSHHTVEEYDEILLLAQNEEGYQHILKLVSQAYSSIERSQSPHITYGELHQYHAGLILLSGGPKGPLGQAILQRRLDDADALASQWKDIFGDRFYIELMRHELAEENETEEHMIELALKHNIPLVATNDVYFSERNMHLAHDALLCIADGSYVVEEERRKVTDEHYFKSTREMQKLFADIPEAIANTVQIAKRCGVMSENRPPMLPHFNCEGGRDEAEELAFVAEQGLKSRLESQVFTEKMSDAEKEEIAKPYQERLAYELEVITSMKFPGYFLIVSDFMRWSKAQDIPVGPGRGSGAGSLVAWSLEITDLNPLQFGLLFERFLNPERVSMPDFDIDFCQERREEVIRYVQEKYGADRVAQIITFGKLQARAVLRDVGRVLQMPYNQVDRITKMIPFNPIDPVTLSKALSMDKELQKMCQQDPDVKELVDIGLKLEGLYRHASTHAAGVVIADRPLEELVPVYRDPRSDLPVCGYSMKYAESAGLVKFDFLGLKTLTVLAKALAFIKARGAEIDLATIPIDDRATFDMLSKGDSVGVFQLESAGMRDTLRKLKPDNIEDIIALVSLYRPGPMDNIPSYIARKHGTETPDYLHEMLEHILKETYGVIIYQEQVMEIARVMGGYSLGGADLLRRAMGKKIASEMDAQRKIFVEGAIKNKVDEKQASQIFDLVAKFAGYGFNKSHAAAYSMIAYQTAYLKANYPVEFLAASMNLDIGDTDKITTFRQDALNLNIEMLPPDINKSQAYFVPEGERGIRYGLGALKNVSVGTMKEMEKERQKNGDFKDVFDFVSRMPAQSINKRQLEQLIKSGSFDHISDSRHRLFAGLETILGYGQLKQSESQSKQASLFAAVEEEGGDKPNLPECAGWSELERMQYEFEAIGLYLSAHPLDLYHDILALLGLTGSAELEENLTEGVTSVSMGGVVISKKIRSSAKGRFATVLLSDPSGVYEISIFDEDLLSNVRDLLDSGTLLWIEAAARKDEGGVRLIADAIHLLDEHISRQSFKAVLSLDNTQAIASLSSHMQQQKRGQVRLNICYQKGERHIDISLDHESHRLDVKEIPHIRALPGVKGLELKRA